MHGAQDIVSDDESDAGEPPPATLPSGEESGVTNLLKDEDKSKVAHTHLLSQMSAVRQKRAPPDLSGVCLCCHTLSLALPAR